MKKETSSFKYYKILQKTKAYYRNNILESCRNKKVLEIGCGEGLHPIKWAQKGAIVTAIDNSEIKIEKAKKLASQIGISIDFQVMDANKLQFENNSFDMVVCQSALHHLDLESVYSSIHKVLKNTGKGIFFEPLGHNFFINQYRKRTPQLRDKDEHAFLMKDIKLSKKFFNNVNVEYFNLLTLIAIPLINSKLFSPFFTFLNLLDKLFLSIFPFLKKYCWITIITLTNPKKLQPK